MNKVSSKFDNKHVKEKIGWWMNILDKIIISKKRFCPPHYLPHKLPFGKKICNEECHIHDAWWRMHHHSSFCKIIKYKNYSFMKKNHRQYLKDKEQKIKK